MRTSAGFSALAALVADTKDGFVEAGLSEVKETKTIAGHRPVPIPSTLMPLLKRMRRASTSRSSTSCSKSAGKKGLSALLGERVAEDVALVDEREVARAARVRQGALQLQGYRVNGKKYYSTGSLFSTYTAIFASTPEGKVVPVDRKGLKLEDDWDGFGQRLTGTGSTILDDVFVAEEESRLVRSPQSSS